MNRNELLKNCDAHLDLIIIGGGATGLGAAVDGASRGFKTLLLEQHDFAKGTSSRSTKLIHGGLRYLKQGNLSLVTEALKERGLLAQNAPHLVHPLPFLVPHYHFWERPFYGIGIKLYDILAGKLRLQKSKYLTREEILQQIPTIESKGLRGGTVYYDGQFDDTRLAIALAQTCVDLGGTVLNYMPVTQLLKENEKIVGVVAKDLESGKVHRFFAKAIINATGVFSDALRKIDDPNAPEIIAPSQGIHLVLPRSFMPSETAILIPKTDDGRVVFFIPWHDHLLIGTTDTPCKNISLEPKPLETEITFLLELAARYLSPAPTRSDILSIFTGLRPLVKAKRDKSTAALSRDHTILIASSGLITIAGGKWTTYRKMGQDVIDKAIDVGHLAYRPCKTEHLRLHDSFALKLKNLIQNHPELEKPLHKDLPYLAAEVIWAVRHEMARTLEDVLARRTRALFLDAKAALEMAPKTAEIMAKELQKDSDWINAELKAFEEVASAFLPLTSGQNFHYTHPMIPKQILDTLIQRLIETYKPLVIYLFGSYAWGTPHKDSDLDLMIIVDHSTQASYERPRAGYHALFGLGIFKDILVYTKSEFKEEAEDTSTLCHKISKDAVKLYEKS
jgi:glycerol-3-phosphate dehydrogenase